MIIAVAHTKGGVGKSTIAWNMAFYLNKKKKTKVLDLDFQQTLFVTNKIRKNKKLKSFDVETISSVDELLKKRECNGVIDIGGFDSALNRKAIEIADAIVVPLSNSLTEVIGLKTFELILNELNKQNVFVVLNNVHPLSKNFSDIEKVIKRNKNFTLLKQKIKQKKSFKSSIALGKSIFESKDYEAKKDFKSFMDELLRGCENVL